jgi:hypothetical protein
MRRRVDRVIERARTDWPRLLGYLLLAAAAALGIYFGLASRIEKRVVQKQGTPCVDTRRGPGMVP